MNNMFGMQLPHHQEEKKKELIANSDQVALLNKMLPNGYKFQLTDTLGKPELEEDLAPTRPQRKNKGVINATNNGVDQETYGEL